MDQKIIAEAYQPLFDLMSREYGLTLLVSEMDEIIGAVDKVKESLNEIFRAKCDVEGCEELPSSGGMCWKETGYWSVCYKHSTIWREGKEQPKMKDEAMAREKSRGADGLLPVTSC